MLRESSEDGRPGLASGPACQERDSATVSLDDPEVYFQRLDAFDRLHWWPEAMRRVSLGCLRWILKGRSGQRLLDVGCGTGRNLHTLSSIQEITAAFGVEPERAAIARAAPGHPLVQGNAVRLPFGAGAFDVATCFDVLQHLPDDADVLALKEIARVLRKDGILIVRANAGGATGYRLRSLREKAERAGFRVIRSSYLNMVPAFVAELAGWLLGGKGHPDGQGLPQPSPRGWGSRLIGWVALCEVWVLLRMGIDLPWGHSTLIVAQKSAG